MSLNMEDILANQYQLKEGMEQLVRNFKKDPRDRKTPTYIKKRLETLETYWEEFQSNHVQLCEFDTRGCTYFSENIYQSTQKFYLEAKETIQQFNISGAIPKPRDHSPGVSSIHKISDQYQDSFEKKRRATEVSVEKKQSDQNFEKPASAILYKTASRGSPSKLEDMLRRQQSHFKAFSRTVTNIDLEDISEKWEYSDLLKTIENRWSTIDSLHWEIDSEMLEENQEYEQAYNKYEQMYIKMKKIINSKMWSASYRENCTPKMDIPIFSGNYHKWTSFQDLFSEAIHNNKSMSSAQKMQFLKSKLKGEAERLVQHLNISTENYRVCWDILNHRYNNKKLIFSSHINILLSLHTMQQQSDIQIKNILDTTNECLHAIKNLGINIETWDPLIIHLLSQKLDPQTHKEYIESLENPRDLPRLSDFLTFLENKYTSLESSRRKQNFQKSVTPNPPPGRDTYQNRPFKKQFLNKTYNFNSKGEPSKPFIGTTPMKSLATKVLTCPLCKDSHGLFHCKIFLESDSDEKRSTIKKLNLCKNCLYDHKEKACFSTAKCRVCQGRHNTLLHDAFLTETDSNDTHVTTNALPFTSRDQQKNRSNVTHVSKDNVSEILLATALIRIKGTNGSDYIMRALIDQGSQASLMTENAAQLLGLPRQACKGVVFGVGSNQNNCKGIINIEASSLHNHFTFKTDVFIMRNLINNLPNQTFSNPSWSYLKDIELADPDFNISRPVDILFGADVFQEIIMGGIIKKCDSEPVAQQTQLGWILCGSVKSFHCNVVLNNIEHIQRYWAIEDINDNNIDMSTEDHYCIEQYKSETIRRKDGKYIVRLPLKQDIEQKIGESKQKAVAQFLQLEKRFLKNRKIAFEYTSFINEYIELGHMRQCTQKKSPDCILPHHCVLREDSSTTALRVVFNASAKTSTGNSLNDMMFRGPNLQQDLFTLILKWRQYQYVFTADIEKMFRQIICNEKDVQYQKIVWRDSPKEVLQDYELTTVTYGTKAAPFLAMMTLKQLAEDERKNYPTASRVLEEDFYMDDVLAGEHCLKTAIQLKTDLKNLLKSGGFNLRKFSSNRLEILDDNSNDTQQDFEFRHQESTKTLGLRWLPREDQFKFQIKINSSSNTNVTKRILLSDISKIFDPLGWLSPLSTTLKLLFQKVWSMNLHWDDAVPEEIKVEWLKLKKSPPDIENIKIQRWLQTHQAETIELHGFCDASLKAYACVIYCRTIPNNHTSNISRVTIVAGKSRLVPVKKSVSLPRLELSAAHLLSKLMKVVQKCFTHNQIRIYCWSDSSAVLAWLQGDSNRWKPFVANRTKQINDVIQTNRWRYVRSADNPADCASRGLSIEQLIKHPLWWQGPSWLPSYNDSEYKNQPKFITQEEVKKQKYINVIQQNDDVALNILNKYSNFNRATRILAWTLRAISHNKQKPKYLTVKEMETATRILIKRVQYIEFQEDIFNIKKYKQVNSKSKLLKFNPFLDQEGLLRVGGRLRNAYIHENMQYPLIIPHTSHLTNLLIDQGHRMTFHGGARLTLAWLRQQYWILGGTRAVKKRLRSCVQCRRHNPIKQEQIMGDLPSARCNPSRPFYHSGVDFTGFVEVKANKGRGIRTTKGYIAVFVCMATKGVHLELVSDLSSSSLLAALRRMAARRGTPAHIYSDNGTNFVGANRVLQEEFINLRNITDNNFHDTLTSMGITWHFNAPSWPSAGGLWEAAVKSLKFHLKRVIGEQKLTFEEYTTLLAEIEACLNSRPLCALSEDPEDFNYLTPSHFLSSGPTLTIIQTEKDLRTRWQLVQKLFEDTWKRWRTEYLCQLSARSKWQNPHQNLKINDVVIIHDANLPAGKWAIGRIIEVHPGKDGYVRIVTVQTKNGKIKRPITKLSPLIIDDTSSQNYNKKPESLKKTNKLCNFVYMLMLTMLLLLFASPASAEHKLSIFNNNQTIYFDKMFDLRLERDEWKLIVYSDMSPYWRGILLMKDYIDHLENICSKYKISQCNVITLQLTHGYNELEHYNNILLGQQGEARARRRRGLINGIGAIAHTLFGVLDESFAHQYQKDIELIKTNQNHLAVLWKNQTSIVEAELNVIRRVEGAINKQHKLINQYITSMNNGFQQLKDDIQKNDINNDFTVSSIIANNMMLNMKTIQETLINMLIDLNSGKLNIHILTPEQLRSELSIITGQLSKDLTLPLNNIQANLAKFFHLLKVKARATKQYMIFEIKIPLVSRENYEVYELIPIPHKIEENMVTLVPIAQYLAMNIHKDFYIPLTVTDVQKCMPSDASEYICPLRSPIFQIKTDESLCVKNQITNQCLTQTNICKDMTWRELTILNSYMYFCCGQCTVRILCEDNITSEQISKAGVMTLSEGCIIKGASFTIYSHKEYSNSMKTQADLIHVDIPPINNIINLSIPLLPTSNETNEIMGQQMDINEVSLAIENMKKEEANVMAGSVSYHDIHHYVAIYVMCGIMAVVGAIYLWRRVYSRSARAILQQAAPAEEPCVRFTVAAAPEPATAAPEPRRPDLALPRRANTLNRATSPIIKKHFTS